MIGAAVRVIVTVIAVVVTATIYRASNSFMTADFLIRIPIRRAPAASSGADSMPSWLVSCTHAHAHACNRSIDIRMHMAVHESIQASTCLHPCARTCPSHTNSCSVSYSNARRVANSRTSSRTASSSAGDTSTRLPSFGKSSVSLSVSHFGSWHTTGEIIRRHIG